MSAFTPRSATLLASLVATSLIFGCGTTDTDGDNTNPADTPTPTVEATPTETATATAATTATPDITETPVATDTPEATETPDVTDTPDETEAPTATPTEGEPGTIPEVAEGAGTFTTLLAAVDAAGLGEALSGEGPLTVFAPDDAAFAKLDPALLQSLIDNPTVLEDILLYHVVDGAVPSEVAVTLTSATTLQGGTFPVALEGEGEDQVLKVGAATVTATDIPASNGIIHVIDTVLLPPGLDVIPTVARAGGYNTLAVALDAAGLTAALTDPGPFTVFAPTDDAFNALGTELLTSLTANPLTLGQILLYHVVEGAVPASAVVELTSATTLQGSDVAIDAQEGVKVNEANVTATDILALNGLVHELDAVIVPPAIKLIPDVATDIGRFETLLTAVGVAELGETLSSAGPFTLLAPNDDAFAKIPEEDLNALLADKDALTDVLLYHVISQAVPAEDVVTLTSAATAQGANVTITVEGETVKINDSTVLTTDVPALNGIIHEIDTVLMPPTPAPEEM